jgi:hypothetical protein
VSTFVLHAENIRRYSQIPIERATPRQIAANEEASREAGANNSV